ncbi:unnamed protein product [Dicrocoelium dendriticum]|nr:unnamed protein product [Dicrocoelium dendriticum]
MYFVYLPRVIIEPLAEATLSVTFRAQQRGRLERTLKISICDVETAELVVPVTCVGEGPVLHVEPTSVNWGTIPVLQTTTRCIRLTNESAIDATFTVKTAQFVPLHLIRNRATLRPYEDDSIQIHPSGACGVALSSGRSLIDTDSATAPPTQITGHYHFIAPGE